MSVCVYPNNCLDSCLTVIWGKKCKLHHQKRQIWHANDEPSAFVILQIIHAFGALQYLTSSSSFFFPSIYFVVSSAATVLYFSSLDQYFTSIEFQTVATAFCVQIDQTNSDIFSFRGSKGPFAFRATSVVSRITLESKVFRLFCDI